MGLSASGLGGFRVPGLMFKDSKGLHLHTPEGTVLYGSMVGFPSKSTKP